MHVSPRIPLFLLSVFTAAACTRGQGSGSPFSPLKPAGAPAPQASGTPPPTTQAPPATAAAKPWPLPTFDAGPFGQEKQVARMLLPGGGYIAAKEMDGHHYMTVEGVLGDAGYASVQTAASARGLSATDRAALLDSELGAATAALKAALGGDGKLINARTSPDVGFFTAMVDVDAYDALAQAGAANRPDGKSDSGMLYMRSLKTGQLLAMSNTAGLAHDLMIAPAVMQPLGGQTRKIDDEPGATEILGTDGRDDLSSFSGLVRLGVPEFLAKVKDELGGATADGSSVKVGVTDTGITLNHPTFTGADGKPRIDYLKDFTGEGRIYFSPGAKLTVTVPTADSLPDALKADAANVLVLDAEVLQPAAMLQKPVEGEFFKLSHLPILVGDELKTILTTAGSGARIGVLPESVFANAEDGPMDLNENGRTNDWLLAVYVPGKNGAPDRVFLDIAGITEPKPTDTGLTGTPDFRPAKAGLSAWNTSKTTLKLFSETLGLDLKTDQIPTHGSDALTDVPSASLVGIDPGNHGSHVSGIIAGAHTFANDDADTLARGVAPAARLMVNRVCANNGGCISNEAMIDLAKAGAEVVNMSLGGLSPYNDGYGVDETLVNRLTEVYGTLFVIAAGNEGPGLQTVGSPASARLALAIGATANKKMIQRQYQYPGLGGAKGDAAGDEDFMLYFSSRGPLGNGGFKPNVTAPGTELSSIRLNQAPGQRAGLDVYWGTSMATPSATGAVALLLDAAKKYNAAHPTQKLPVDALTLRNVLMASARPFDAATFDPETGKTTLGQYTWADQGTGMINLPAAWDELKKARDGALPPSFTDKDGAAIPLEIVPRTLFTNRYGFAYDGSRSDPQSGVKFYGSGLWLDPNGTETLEQVQLERRMPDQYAQRADYGDLMRLLNTTRDTFVLKTTFYGAPVAWAKAGTLTQLDCATAPASNVTIVGQGALPTTLVTPVVGIQDMRESLLNVCIDRSAVAALPPGDHGALIKGYRTVDGKVEAEPSFIVPVFIAVPSKTLAGRSGYEITREVKSFQVQRNYVDVPKGTSLLKITMELPPAVTTPDGVKGCMGIELLPLEGENDMVSPEAAGHKSFTTNCDPNGRPSDATRTFQLARFNPRPGMWDVHVYGRSQYPSSTFTLKVEYAKLTPSVAGITGAKDLLTGSLDLTVDDASIAVEPSADKSTYALSGFRATAQPLVQKGQDLQVPTPAGAAAHTYDAAVTAVTVTTGDSPGNDVDLTVLECAAADLKTCAVKGTSGGPTADESVTFQPTAGKFYGMIVNGFSCPPTGCKFTFTETETLTGVVAAGKLAITKVSETKFTIGYAMDGTNPVLGNALFTSGQYAAIGSLGLKAADGASLLQLPVSITK